MTGEVRPTCQSQFSTALGLERIVKPIHTQSTPRPLPSTLALAHLQTSVHGARIPNANVRPHRLVIESGLQAITAERRPLAFLAWDPSDLGKASEGLFSRPPLVWALDPQTQPTSTYIYEPKGLLLQLYHSNDLLPPTNSSARIRRQTSRSCLTQSSPKTGHITHSSRSSHIQRVGAVQELHSA